MSLNVNSIGYGYRKPNFGAETTPATNPQSKNVGQVPAEAQDSDKKEGMSTTTKVLTGLAALAAVGTAAYFIVHHNSKEADSAIKKGKNAVNDVVSDTKGSAGEVKKAKINAEIIDKIPAEKSKNLGETVQETIDNVLGKNSSITPHNYDISQEYHTMHVYRNQGGYKDAYLTKNGVIPSDAISPKDSLYPKDELHIVNVAAVNPQHSAKLIKNKVVRLAMPDPQDEDRGLKMILTLISPNNQYTPAQKDLLKLVQNPKKIDKNVFSEIFKFKNAIDSDGNIIFENSGQYENLDFDLILSAISSMAKNV